MNEKARLKPIHQTERLQSESVSKPAEEIKIQSPKTTLVVHVHKTEDRTKRQLNTLNILYILSNLNTVNSPQ